MWSRAEAAGTAPGRSDRTRFKSAQLLNTGSAPHLPDWGFLRPIFEGDPAGAAPTKRDVSLVIGFPLGGCHLQVFEVLDVVFDLLAALDDWTDPATIETTPELKQVMDELADHGLVEVHA